MSHLSSGRGVTIKDIAAALGIAHTTVSRALNDHPHINEQTKARVRSSAAELGYVANSGARLMRSGTNRAIGLIVPDVLNPFYGSAATVLSEACATRGYQLLLAVSEDDPDIECRHIQALREARISGLLIAPSAHPRRASIQQLAQIATVQFLRRHPAIQGPSVRADDARGVAMATEHLFSLGHRDIGYIGVFESLSTGKARLEGYRQALRTGGREERPALTLLGEPTLDFGREALRELLALARPPSAVVAASPRIVLGALETIGKLDLALPDDLSIVAYSDSDVLRIWKPGITAVALPVAAMVAAAASILFQEIRGSLPTGSAVSAPFEPVFIERASAGPPNLATAGALA